MNFKLFLENVLQKIDNFFKVKSKKDTYIIYIMIVAILFSIAYPFYDLSIDEFSTKRKSVSTLVSKLAEDNLYLNSNSEAKVAKLDREIKALESAYAAEKEKNEYIKNKIETISSLVYNDKAWGSYLNSISASAKKHNVHILSFTNSYLQESRSSFGHVLDISLKIKGNYLNTVGFINSLEQSDLVVDVHDFSIDTNETLKSDINISVWGITYQ